MCAVSFPIWLPLPHPGEFSVTENHFGVGMWSTAKLTLLSKTQLLAFIQVQGTWLSLYHFWHALVFKVSLKEFFPPNMKIQPILKWKQNKKQVLLCSNPLAWNAIFPEVRDLL